MIEQIKADDMPEVMGQMAADLRDNPLTNTLEAVGELIQQGIAANFYKAEGPDGTRWAARKDDLPHPELIDTGALFAAATGEHTASILRVQHGRTLEVGLDKSVDDGGIKGAAVHNFGYPPRKIPQREWLYATDDVLDEAARLIAERGITELFVI